MERNIETSSHLDLVRALIPLLLLSFVTVPSLVIGAIFLSSSFAYLAAANLMFMFGTFLYVQWFNKHYSGWSQPMSN